MSRFRAFSLLSSVLVLASAAFAQEPAQPKALKIMDPTAIDKSVDPCQNFYEYACGNWRKNNPIPPDQAVWGRFNELNERNRWLTYEILKKAAVDSASRPPLEKQYGDFFAACMNTEKVESLGREPIEPQLAMVAQLKSPAEIAMLTGHLRGNDAVDVLFRFNSEQDLKNSAEQIAAAEQGGLGLPDRGYYTDDDDRSKKIREQYVEHVTAMFKLLGDDNARAAEEAANVMRIETALAQASYTRVQRRDPDGNYHRMSLAEFQKLTPNFDWSVFLRGVHAPPISDNLNVGQPEFFTALNGLITSAPLSAWQSYFRWQITHAAAQWLSPPFVDENFRFYGETLSGQKELPARWKRCTSLTDMALGEAIGQEWVKENFPGDSKVRMQKLVAALETALNQDIAQLDWMSPATKAEAEKKLAAVRNKIGYPEHWRDYSSIVVKRDDLLGNQRRAADFEYHRRLNKIGKPVDEKEWGMTPPTVNAYYSPEQNDINFPAGILQPPFYSPDAPIAADFGGIGAVIGHEITHGFDDQGSKYDPQGNRREWYTAEDRKKFDERTDCEVKEYDGFEPVAGQKLNGKLTLGENTADNGGVRIAYIALMNTLKQDPSLGGTVDGYTPAQQFFVTYGQIWCQNNTDAAARLRARTDPHSPGEFRVNGVLRNFSEFGKAFGCKPGSPMMPENACRVW